MPTTDTDPTPVHTRVLEDQDLWTLSEHVDLSATAETVRSLPADGTGLVPALTDTATHVTYRDRSTGTDTLLPRSALGALGDAARLAAEARRLVGAGTLTVGMIGPIPRLWWYAGVLGRALTGITDLRLCISRSADEDRDERPLPRLVDQLDLAGVGLTLTDDPGAIAFGSTLVVVAAPLDLSSERIIPGALVIEAAPGMLPAEVHRRAAAVLPFGTRPARLPADGYVVLHPADDDAGVAHRVAADLLAAGSRLGLVPPS
ncbi:hypothetical protein [Actinoplanes sp. NPDC049118]|uniref:hypothetical protein n=1 Tax=Actinoplanes sp. NPDC049118 TaxID=3155769 RepID=UPI0033C76099